MIKKPTPQAGARISPVLCVIACFTFFNNAGLLANPAGESVVAGNAAFDRTGNTLRITTGNRTIINWQDFSIASGEQTKFIQPSASSTTLNRVVGGNLSSIYGSLESNGRIFLINPNGVLVGPNGRVNAAGFLASTVDTTNAEFLKGNDLKFTGGSAASVVNQGSITAVGGDVFLIGRQVENIGSLAAPNGTVGLAAGQEVLLKQKGNERIFVKPATSGSGSGTGIANSGRVEAIQAELKASGNIYALAINNTGTIRATGAVHRGGRVLLVGNGGNINHAGRIIAKNANGSGGKITADAGAGGDLIVSGLVDASGKAPGTTGGSVQLLGDNVGLAGFAKVDVSGDAGGGEALIGGGLHGTNPQVRDALHVFMGGDAVVEAGAITRGNGGRVVLWSNEATRYYGSINATGGLTGGSGGNVEISSKGSLAFLGKVNLDAQQGSQGSLLLDPYNILITNAPGANDGDIAASQANSVLFGDGAAADYIIGAAALEALSGNIVLQAQNNITLEVPLNLIHQTPTDRFVLQAGNDLTITSRSSIKTNASIFLEADSPHEGGADGLGILTISGSVTSVSGAIQLIGAGFNISGTVTNGVSVSFQGLTSSTSSATVTYSGALPDGFGLGSIILGQRVNALAPGHFTLENNANKTLASGTAAFTAVNPIWISTSDGSSLTVGPTGRLTAAEIALLNSNYQVLIGKVVTAGSDGLGTGAQTLVTDNIQVSNTPLVVQNGSLVLQAQTDITVDANASVTLRSGEKKTGTTNRLVFQAGNDITLNGKITTGGADLYLEADSPDIGSGADGAGTLAIYSNVGTSNGGCIQMLGADFVINNTVDSGNNRSTRISTSDNSPITIGSGAGNVLTAAEIDMLLSTYQVWVGRTSTAGVNGDGGAYVDGSQYGHGAVENTASDLVFGQTTIFHTRAPIYFYASDSTTISAPLTAIGPVGFDGVLALSGSGSISSTKGSVSIGSTDPAFGGIALGGVTTFINGTNLSAEQLQKIKTPSLTLYAGNSDIVVDNITADKSANIGRVILSTGVSYTDTGTVEFINHASTFNSLTIMSAGGVDVNVPLTVTTGGLSISADRFGAGTGSFTSAADITLAANQSILIDAAAVSIGGKFSSATGSLGSITLQPSTPIQGMTVGGSTGGDGTTFNLLQSDLDHASNNGAAAFTNLVIGRPNGLNAITFDAPLTFYKPVTLRGGTFLGSIGTAAAPVTVPVTLLNANPMTLAADIFTEGQKITVQGPALLGADIRLVTTGISGGAGAGDMILFTSTLNDTTTGGDSMTLNSGPLGNIKFTGPIGTVNPLGSFTATGNNITLPTTILGHRLSVTVSGAFLEKGAIAVGSMDKPGSANFTLLAPNHALTLNLPNRIYGPVSLITSGAIGNATLVNRCETTLASTTSVGGNLTVISTGYILNDAAEPGCGLTVGGVATFKCAGYDIALDNEHNSFGALSVSGRNVTVYEQDATQLLASSVSGMLVLSSGGDITQAANTVLSVIGSSTFNTDNSINLPTAKNHFVGTLSFQGFAGVTGPDSVTLSNNTSTILADSSIGGNLSLTTKGGIWQTGSIAVSGTFTAISKGAILLTNTHNAFSTLGDIARGSTLNLIDSGPGGLTLAGVISGGGKTDVSIISSGGDLTLRETSNGTTAISGGHITLATSGNFNNLSHSLLSQKYWWRIYYAGLTGEGQGGLVGASESNIHFAIPLPPPLVNLNKNVFLYP